MMYGIQLGLLAAIAISVCGIIAAFTLLKKKEDDVEDDLGYLEHIYDDMEEVK